uniref:Uncharacterized protein n=1 Tax=Cryptomonas curvata TaxID=233186 RepID=A0A7S0MLU3_9CRYP|mmetsp:Transcript_47593/g.99588  ORF Transcript_47593/g.99588 Transcript_47593/m.99588 type:complete len:145 (+) Transcript_47593:226-660(+)|eukprot:CAMPEP_0172160414 /NCGR_PEP_ID=MMETSP1050-20130122/5544_1 /TAXON_ID=233186 /ORGANISM="Cryptomonas curvata, Strain CCAP979/52" /LENGTH=144 /DNA_ID=CAMNT_0012830173 /DNA_START=239 /DNA_END=673 /DNA_ORIENTATION=+
MSHNVIVWTDRYVETLGYIDKNPSIKLPVGGTKHMTLYKMSGTSTLSVSVFDGSEEEEECKLMFDMYLSPDKFQALFQTREVRKDDDDVFVDLGGAGRLKGYWMSVMDDTPQHCYLVSLSLTDDDWVGEKPDVFLDFLIDFWLA